MKIFVCLCLTIGLLQILSGCCGQEIAPTECVKEHNVNAKDIAFLVNCKKDKGADDEDVDDITKVDEHNCFVARVYCVLRGATTDHCKITGIIATIHGTTELHCAYIYETDFKMHCTGNIHKPWTEVKDVFRTECLEVTRKYPDKPYTTISYFGITSPQWIKVKPYFASTAWTTECETKIKTNQLDKKIFNGPLCAANDQSDQAVAAKYFCSQQCNDKCGGVAWTKATCNFGQITVDATSINDPRLLTIRCECQVDTTKPPCKPSCESNWKTVEEYLISTCAPMDKTKCTFMLDNTLSEANTKVFSTAIYEPPLFPDKTCYLISATGTDFEKAEKTCTENAYNYGHLALFHDKSLMTNMEDKLSPTQKAHCFWTGLKPEKTWVKEPWQLYYFGNYKQINCEAVHWHDPEICKDKTIKECACLNLNQIATKIGHEAFTQCSTKKQYAICEFAKQRVEPRFLKIPTTRGQAYGLHLGTVATVQDCAKLCRESIQKGNSCMSFTFDTVPINDPNCFLHSRLIGETNPAIEIGFNSYDICHDVANCQEINALQ